MKVFNHVNEKALLEGDAFAAGDVTGDGDGNITIADAIKIFNFVNEKIDTLD